MFLRLRQGLSVDADGVRLRVRTLSQGGGAAVHRHPPGGDELLRLPPGGDPPGGQ